MLLHRPGLRSIVSGRNAGLAILVGGLVCLAPLGAWSAEEEVLAHVRSISTFTELNLSALAGGEI